MLEKNEHTLPKSLLHLWEPNDIVLIKKLSYRGLVNNKHNVQVCEKVFSDK